jgi:hypothetical protein
VLVCADHAAIHVVGRPIELTSCIASLLQGGQERIPDAAVYPAAELAGDALPRAIAFWQVAPRDPGGMQPQNAIEHPAAITADKPALRVGQEWLKPRPLVVSEFMSMCHPLSV